MGIIGVGIVDNYKELVTISSMLGVAFAVIAGGFARDWLYDKGVSNDLVLILVLCFIVALSEISGLIIKRIISWSRVLRTFLLGRQYLEGTWIDMVKCNGNIVGYGLITVSSDLGSIYINGQDYSIAIEPQGTFESHNLIIDWPKITYIYSAQSPGKNNPLIEGISILNIHENIGSTPNHWTGVFVDLFDENNNRFHTEAWKIKDKSVIDKLKTPELREDSLKELIKKYFVKPPQLVTAIQK